jgi:hypothetical protein
MADEPKDPANQTTPPSSFDWKAFSQKTWVIVIGGILFPPIGMILTWLKPGWSTRTKWIATGVLCLLLIARNQPKKDTSEQEDQAPASAQASEADNRGVEVVRATPSRQTDRETPIAKDTPAPRPQDTVSVEKTIQPMPDLKSRVRRGWTESDQAYRDRIFNRTVVAVLEHYYEVPCTPGDWTPMKMESASGTPNEYSAVVTRADGKKVNVRLRDKNYQFVWAAYEGGTSPQDAVGYWLRDGRIISDQDFASFKGDVAAIASDKAAAATTAKAKGTESSPADEREDPDYQEGYRYARGILEAAKRAPPSAKRQIMQPLVDLAAEAERGAGSKPRLFYKGVSKAMLDVMN